MPDLPAKSVKKRSQDQLSMGRKNVGGKWLPRADGNAVNPTHIPSRSKDVKTWLGGGGPIHKRMPRTPNHFNSGSERATA